MGLLGFSGGGARSKSAQKILHIFFNLLYIARYPGLDLYKKFKINYYIGQTNCLESDILADELKNT